MRFIRSLFQPTLTDRKRKELHQAQVALLHCQTQAEYYSNMSVYYRGIMRRLQADKELADEPDK
jgi:hypothetical protein